MTTSNSIDSMEEVVIETNVEKVTGSDAVDDEQINTACVGANIVEVDEGSHTVVNEADQPLETDDLIVSEVSQLLQDKDEEVLLEKDDDIDDGQLVVSSNNVTREVEYEFPASSFLINLLRFEDDKLDEQIKAAELQLYEKKRRAQEIMAARVIKVENMMIHKEAFNAKIFELRNARQLVKSKGQQIDHVQRVMNKVKNVIALKDTESKIYKVQHMIEHGKLSLKYKTQLTQEIEQLKSKRARLASQMDNPYELQHALDQKSQIEELLKDLNSELETMKENVSNIHVASNTKWKEYVEEHDMERELCAQLIVAEESRHEAEEHLHNLETQLSDKVERFKDECNLNEEFRKDYISTRDIFATLDTCDDPSCVVPDEPFIPTEIDPDEPIIPTDIVPDEPIIPTEIENNEEKEKTDELAKEETEAELKESTKKTQTQTEMRAQQREKDKHSGVLPDDTDEIMIAREWDETEFVTLERQKRFVEGNHSDDQTKANVLEESWITVKNKKRVKKEIETKLKEIVELEEKVTANEANEKQYLEKAQTLAEVQAKKEAQQREKARLKRLRKKERKRSARDDANNISVNTESANGKQDQQLVPRPPFLPEPLKTNIIPPHPSVAATLENKKGARHWGKMVITLIILVLYVLKTIWSYCHNFKSICS